MAPAWVALDLRAKPDTRGVRIAHACHPSVQPRGPQRRWGDEPLQARLEAADAAPEEGGQAAAEVAGLSVRGFFPSGVAPWTASHIPVETAQNRASAMTRMRRSRRSGRRRWLSSRPKPRVLKSLNMASIPHLSPESKARWTVGASDRAMIQGSGWPAS